MIPVSCDSEALEGFGGPPVKTIIVSSDMIVEMIQRMRLITGAVPCTTTGLPVKSGVCKVRPEESAQCQAPMTTLHAWTGPVPKLVGVP
jgi:hypothetical protein